MPCNAMSKDRDKSEDFGYHECSACNNLVDRCRSGNRHVSVCIRDVHIVCHTCKQ